MYSKWLQRDGLALLSFTLATLIMTYPLVANLGSSWLPAQGGDILHKLWDVWWLNRAITHGEPLFFTHDVFYPTGINLGYHPVNWLETLFTWLVGKLIGVRPAYKLQILLSLIATAYATYLLIQRLVDNRFAAWLGGAIYAFAPYHLVKTRSHPDLAYTFAIPLAVLWLHTGITTGNLIAAIGAGVMVGLTAWMGLYLFVFLILTVGPLLIYLALQDRRYRQPHFWAVVAVFFTVSLATTLPRLWPIITSFDELDAVVEDDYEVRADLLVDPVEYLTPPEESTLREWLGSGHDNINVEKRVYLGLIPLLLFLVGLLTNKDPDRWFWLGITVMFLLMSLGSALHFNAILYEDIKLPAALLLDNLWFTRIVRPHFYQLGLLLPFALLASSGLTMILKWFPENRRLSIGALFIVLVLLEYHGDYYAQRVGTIFPPHSFYSQLAADSSDFAIIELPYKQQIAKEYLYAQTVHEHPISGAVFGRVPTSAFATIDGNPLLSHWYAEDSCDLAFAVEAHAGLDSLQGSGYRYVITHSDDWTSRMASYAYAPPVFQDEQIAVYTLDDLAQSFACGPGLKPLWPPEIAAEIQTIPDSGGKTACGVFDINGHGYQEIVFGFFSDCVDADGAIPAAVNIMCLDGEGDWQPGAVEDLQLNPQRTAMSFTSHQDGTCGIFLRDGES